MERSRSWHGGAYRFLLVLLILFLPVQFATSASLRFAPSDAFLMLLLLFGGIRMVTTRRDWSVWHALILAVLSASVLNSALRYGEVTRWALFNKYLGIVVLLLLYLCVVQYTHSLSTIRQVARLVVLSVVLQAMLALPLYIVGLRYAPLYVPRIQGLAADPNAYGGLIVMALALHWATVNTNARLVPRLLAWPVTVVLLCNLLFSFSRSSWIAFAFVACVTPILRRRSWAHVIAPIGLATVLVLLFFRSYFAAEMWPLVARPSQVVGRFTILEKAVEAFVAHPITGAGLGSYLQEYGLQVHNTLFWMLAEMGVVGAVVFVGFALTFVIRGWRAYRMTDEENKGVVAGLLIAHLAMLGLSLGIEALYQRSWWVVMALLNASWALVSIRGTRASSSFVDRLSVDTHMSVGS